MINVKFFAFIALAKAGTLKEEDQKHLDLLTKNAWNQKQKWLQPIPSAKGYVTKKEGDLTEWIKIEGAEGSALNGFEKRLDQEYREINQSVISTISNGQLEGLIKRL